MPFSFTTPSIADGSDWTHTLWAQLVEDLRGLAIDISDVGSAPLQLTRRRQHLDGSGNHIYDFSRWFGLGSDVSVREVTGFDADPTGVAQSGALINQAIDDLPASGGVVLIPPGTYTIETPLDLADTAGNSNFVSLIGSGYATNLVLKEDTAVSVINAVGCTSCFVANLRISGNSTGQDGTLLVPAIDFVDTSSAIVTNVWIDDWAGSGIRYGQTSTTTQTMCTIYSCRITGCNGDGIEFYVDRFTPTPNLKQSLIYANLIQGCLGNGILVKQCFGQACISQNMLIENGSNGIKVESVSGASVRNRFSITDNICAGNSACGISLGDDVNDLADLVLKSNICARNLRDGIRFTGTGEIVGVDVFANIMSDNGAYGFRG